MLSYLPQDLFGLSYEGLGGGGGGRGMANRMALLKRIGGFW